MKLRKQNECLSNSLLNNSQIPEDDNAAKEHTVKSAMIIHASKKPDVLNKKLLKESRNTDHINNSPKKKKSRRSLKINDPLPNDKIDKSFIDVVVPNHKFKNNTQPSSSTKETVKQKNEFGITKSQLTDKLSSITSTDSFTVPLSFVEARKSLKSPIYTSSPKVEVQNRKHIAEPSVSGDNLFSSQIVSSSADFKSGTSELLTDNSLFSPIKRPKSANFKNATNLEKSSIGKRDTLRKGRKTANPKVTCYSVPITSQQIVRTRSGRISRSFSQTDLGKFMHEYLFEFYNR